MAEEAINPFTFARDLAQLEQHLEWARGVRRGDGQIGDVCDEIATSFLALLHALADGQDPVPAIYEAIRVLGERSHENRELHKTRSARGRADYERRMAEEEITRGVECPYCGAASGSSCRSTGPARVVRTNSHRDRYRFARSLNEGGADDRSA